MMELMIVDNTEKEWEINSSCAQTKNLESIT